jgi:c-di-GMP-binding flagellar brake protein YcgR
MRLDEISEDSVISIAVIRGNTSVNLQTNPAFATEDGIMVHPFTHDDTIINFNVPDLRIEMIVAREDEVPYFWKTVTISKETFQGEVYHCIRSKMEGVRLNRRNSFRVFIGETGTVVKIPGEKSFQVLIKDISAGGFAFSVRDDEEHEYKRGDQVHIFFEDREARFNLDVTGRVVRVVDDGKRTTYGCSFTRNYPQVDRYCAQKQLKKRQQKTMAPRK